MHPIDILKKNKQLKDRLYVTELNRNNKILHMLIDIHLSPKILINEYSITKELYDNITLVIEKQFYQSKIPPGEMVGPIAAQSIGNLPLK